jgi:hypothetical protein
MSGFRQSRNVLFMKASKTLTVKADSFVTFMNKKRAGKPCPVIQQRHLIYPAFMLPGGRHTIHLYKNVAAGRTDDYFFRNLTRATGAFFVRGLVQPSSGYPGIQADWDQYCQYRKYYICQNHKFVLSDRVVCPVKDGRETAWYIFKIIALFSLCQVGRLAPDHA